MARRAFAVGGLALLLMTSTAFAQPGGGRGRGMMGPMSGAMLLGMPEVRQELGTTDEQNKQLEQIRQDLMGPGGFQGWRDLSNEERQKRVTEADAKVAKVLRSEQLDRLNQLRLQREGAMALTRADVQEKLGLTQEQKDKIKKIQDEARPPQGTNFQNLSDDERAKMREQREKAETDTLAVLNADQKKKLDEMKGKPFDFPRGGPGGGGNRPQN